MAEFTLNLIKNGLYDGLFGLNKKSVKVQRESKNNKSDLKLDEYKVFECNSQIWVNYLSEKYTNDAIRFNDCDFLFVHFANVPEISVELYGSKKNIRENRAAILNGNEEGGRCNDLREAISETLLKNYKNRQNGFGEHIDAIIKVNKYVIYNYCKDCEELDKKIRHILDICEKDNSFPWNSNEKEIFLSHIKAYLRKNEEVAINKEEWSADLSYVLSWLLLAALLRAFFSEFARIIPEEETDVLLRNQREYDFLKKELNKRIKKELESKIQQSHIEKVDRSFLLKGRYFHGDNEFSTSLSDLFKNSWSSTNIISKNMFVVGEGGIGKSLSVLYLLSNDRCNINRIPSLYIPLNLLGGTKSDGIEKNIEWYISTHYSTEYSYIEKIANIRDDSIKIVLFLDGFNEISTLYQYQILKDIKYWEEMPAVQLIVTSRSLPDYMGHFGCFKADSLDQIVIDSFFSRHDIDFSGDCSIFTTPLLLQLYGKSEKIKKTIGFKNIVQLEWHDVKCAADIFWNYLQYEIYRCVEKDRSVQNDNIRISDYFYLILQLCPYIAWKMMGKQALQINETMLEGWVEEAVIFLASDKNVYDNKIEKANTNTGFIDDNRNVNVKKRVSIQLLENLNVLMNKNCAEDSIDYSFMHQDMRDYMVALFINNVLYRDSCNKGYLSESVMRMGDESVLTYLADVVNEEVYFSIWNNLKKKRNTVKEVQKLNDLNDSRSIGFDEDVETEETRDNVLYQESVKWMLRFFGVMYEGDYSQIDFSDMDLNYVSLMECRSDSRQLTLPMESTKYNNTLFSKKSFMPLEQHSGTVSVVKVIKELGLCVSGDYNGDVYIWDIQNNRTLCKLVCKEKERYRAIIEIQYYALENRYYIAVRTYSYVKLFLVEASMLQNITVDSVTSLFCYYNKIVNLRHYKKGSQIYFFKDEDLYLCNVADEGKIGLYNVNKDYYEDIFDVYTNINKIELLRNEDDIYCISANEDFSIDVWNISQKELKKKIICRKKDLNFHEELPSYGIVDFRLFYKSNKWNIVFIVQYCDGVYVSENLFSDKTNYHKLRNGHLTSVSSLEIFNYDNSNWAITYSEDKTIIKWNLDTEKAESKKSFRHNNSDFEYYAEIIKIYENMFMILFWKDLWLCNLLDDQYCNLQEGISDYSCGDIYNLYDDTIFVTGCYNGSIILWKICDNKIIKMHSTSGVLNGVIDMKLIGHKNGKKYLAIVSSDGFIRFWNVDTERCVTEIEVSTIRYVCPCCNGEILLTSADDNSIVIYDISDLNNPKILNRLLGHYRFTPDIEVISDKSFSELKFVSFSRAGFIIWERSFDSFNVIRVGEGFSDNCTSNGIPCHKISDVKCKVNIRSISVIDSNRIITGGFDGSVVVWELNNLIKKHGKLIGKMCDSNGVQHLFVVDEECGKYILAINTNGDIMQFNYDDLGMYKTYFPIKDNDDYILVEKKNDIQHDKYFIEYFQVFGKTGFIGTPGFKKVIHIRLVDDGKRTSVENGNIDLTGRKYCIDNIATSDDFNGSGIRVGSFDNSIVILLDDGKVVIKDMDSTDDNTWYINPLYGISIRGIDFSKAVMSQELRQIIQNNGGKIGE